ncbi:hypothetical protein N665_0022s0017 [Sinapis alba]|nr:hypothetical protein N665_0022s0017 [Sinapis alba]
MPIRRGIRRISWIPRHVPGIEDNPKQINALIEMASLKTKQEFEWSQEREKAFQQLKHYLTTPPVLVKPVEGEPLFLYIVVSAMASHAIVILTTLPLWTILHSPSQSGILEKWAVELSEYDIEYRTRSCAKSQVLAEFLVELPMEGSTGQEPNPTWILHVDESLSKQVSRIRIRLTLPTRKVLEQSFLLTFHASNNEAEYKALIT